jgi:hypothetical protein
LAQQHSSFFRVARFYSDSGKPQKSSAKFGTIVRSLLLQYQVPGFKLWQALHLIYRLKKADEIIQEFMPMRPSSALLMKFVETIFLSALALTYKGTGSHSGIRMALQFENSKYGLKSPAIQSSLYLLDKPPDIVSFSLDPFLRLQSELLQYLDDRIIAAPEEYEEWDTRLTQFMWYFNDHQCVGDTHSIFLPLNSEVPMSLRAVHLNITIFRAPIEDTRFETNPYDVLNYLFPQYSAVRIKGESKDRR